MSSDEITISGGKAFLVGAEIMRTVPLSQVCKELGSIKHNSLIKQTVCLPQRCFIYRELKDSISHKCLVALDIPPSKQRLRYYGNTFSDRKGIRQRAAPIDFEGIVLFPRLLFFHRFSLSEPNNMRPTHIRSHIYTTIQRDRLTKATQVKKALIPNTDTRGKICFGRPLPLNSYIDKKKLSIHDAVQIITNTYFDRTANHDYGFRLPFSSFCRWQQMTTDNKISEIMDEHDYIFKEHTAKPDLLGSLMDVV